MNESIRSDRILIKKTANIMDKATIPAVVYISPSNLCTIDF